MYMMVENKGAADVRAFTKLGLSSAKNQTDKIGQFGSGAKHGVLTLMRSGLNPTIYCGKTKIDFYSQPNTMGNTDYNDMFVKVGNKKPVELSYCLEFGSIDWTDIEMGLREIVSNAIDNVDDKTDIKIEVTDDTRAKDGYTRVFVPLRPEVQRFFNNLSHKFLQFSSRDEAETILNKFDVGSNLVYRKGVFIRELSSHIPGLWDYNFGDELRIDECRNSNTWDCERAIGDVISENRDVVKRMFSRFTEPESDVEEYYEDKMSSYHLHPQQWWHDVWIEVTGEDSVILPPRSTLYDFVKKKGKIPYIVPRGWYDTMSQVDIPRGGSCLNSLEKNGYTPIQPTENAKKLLEETWRWAQDLEMTNNKPKPEVKCFSQVINSESNFLLGYCFGGTVYINKDFDENRQTYLEEIAHYITGSRDNTREFQEFAFQFATRMGEIVYN